MKEIYEIGETPPIGKVPPYMYAQVVRQDRYGEPNDAFKVEKIKTPQPKDDEVLVYVMAAGINYNNVWAAAGQPVDIINLRMKRGDPHDFHIGGSDGSGIIFDVGKNVSKFRTGDQVQIHCGVWDMDEPYIKSGGDSTFSKSLKIWGYETNWGSFSQFCLAKESQCLPKNPNLTWEEAASYLLVGPTAYRMLRGWPPNIVKEGDVVLIWGGSGGLGSMAIQIVNEYGGIPIAVVSDNSRGEYCKSLGARGFINRKNYNLWGKLPDCNDEPAQSIWLKDVRSFGSEIWNIMDFKKNPAIVLEHPGEATFPASTYVCDIGGMVVTCAGTTGYNLTSDIRHLWMRQKRLQGSHYANHKQVEEFNDLVLQNKISPCLSETYLFENIPQIHQRMKDGFSPTGNMSVLVGSPKKGLKSIPL